MSTQYALSAWFFTRALSVVYMVAFISVAVQVRGLWGAQGVLPISGFMDAVKAQTAIDRYLQLPSFFWFGSSDTSLVAAAWLGAACALLAFLGFAQGWMLLLCFALYLSFVNSGQDFMSFQWDVLLLEAGFLALFVVPWALRLDLWTAYEPHWSVRVMFYIVLFKLMFLSGVVKLLSGDPAWRDLSALSYHYWTQPLPNPASPFVHALPMWLHKAGTALTFVIELIVPFLIFWPRLRIAAAIAFTALSLLILTTGNYTFFNLLTIVLCFWLIPNSWWQHLAKHLPVVESPAAMFAHPAPSFIMVVLALLSLYWCTRFWIPESINDKLWTAVRLVHGFHISNPYGLFATMTKTRPEIVIEGSLDGVEWKEYEFKYKPGNVYRRPPIVAPHQPRLDWQMWFAALGSFQQSPWVKNLLIRVMQNSPHVMKFFAFNPFEDQPPKFLRARLYSYVFTPPSEILDKGRWWKRELLGEYSPMLQNSR